MCCRNASDFTHNSNFPISRMHWTNILLYINWATTTYILKFWHTSIVNMFNKQLQTLMLKRNLNNDSLVHNIISQEPSIDSHHILICNSKHFYAILQQICAFQDFKKEKLCISTLFITAVVSPLSIIQHQTVVQRQSPNTYLPVK